MLSLRNIFVYYLPLICSLLFPKGTYYYSKVKQCICKRLNSVCICKVLGHCQLLLFLQDFGEGIVGNLGFTSVRPFLSMPTKRTCVAKICEVLGWMLSLNQSIQKKRKEPFTLRNEVKPDIHPLISEYLRLSVAYISFIQKRKDLLLSFSVERIEWVHNIVFSAWAVESALFLLRILLKTCVGK